MADWGNVSNQLTQGFQLGSAAGGKLSGIGMALNKIATQMTATRTQREEMAQKKNLLGYAAGLEEWKPKTQEEALNFEREKYGIKVESPLAQNEIKRKNLIDSTKIREEFLNRPEIKEYTTINTQVKSMDSLLKKAQEGNIQNKVALDQGLITMFNKLTDPNSVVRESEYARTPENLPLTNRFSGALQKLQKGGAGLTDSDRKALVWGAKVIANERGNTFNQTLQEYKDLSNQYGIEESLITRGTKPHQEYNIGNLGNVNQSDMVTVQDPLGRTIQMSRQEAIARGAK